MATTNEKSSAKKIVKIVLIVLAAIAVGVVGYRYYNRPVQTWNADVFEGRNPDKIDVKGQGQKYWQANAAGQGFYVTDVDIAAGESKTYCVSGGVGSDAATFTLGDAEFEAKNGFFTRCANITVGDKHQISFSVKSGELQVYRVDRKR